MSNGTSQPERHESRDPVAALAILYARRSIRKYSPEPVSDDQVRLLLEGAMAAPSAHNLQPWRFVVVRDAETRAALAATHDFSRMVARAPVVIAVCADKSAVHWVEDGAAAAENILLAATALGLGAVWVAVHPNAQYDAFVRGVLEVPENLGIVCMIAVGHPAEQKAARTQYDESKVLRERFQT